MPELSASTHVLMERELVLYKRERSNIWQCRYKVDGKWQRASTKEHNLDRAKEAAKELQLEAKIRKRDNLPVITRYFRDIAKLAIKRMEDELKAGKGKAIYKDYILVIKNYLIPFLGKRKITNIDYTALDELDAWRITKMEKVPTQSTMLTHNAALKRVFDEAELRGYLTEANRPKLDVKGSKSKRRADFSLVEVKALLANFESWIERARTKQSKAMRFVLSNYVAVLLDTGARPGKELLNLKWKQIKIDMRPDITKTGEIQEIDGVEEEVVIVKGNRAVLMVVTGKTGTREIVGNYRTIIALNKMITMNYGANKSLHELTTSNNDDYVFTTPKKDRPTNFNNMFESYLDEHSLLIDPKTEQKRVLYSLRHTYATLALTHDKVPIHTLAKQMGTSVGMIEKHYSHLKVIQAIDQLRGIESRQLIEAGSVIDDMYKSKKADAKKAKAKQSF